jgi:hypothetical protein
MPIALVKVLCHPIKDTSFGILPFIEKVSITLIDDDFKQHLHNFNYPSVYDSNYISVNIDEENVSPSANKIIADTNKDILETMKEVSLIYCRTKIEKKLLSDIVEKTPIRVIH